MKWTHRSTLYKFTLVFLYFIFLVFMLAFSVPTWWGSSDSFQGLWQACTQASDDVDFDHCSTVTWGDDVSTDWMDGVRGVWLAGACFYLMAVMVSMCQNCCCGSEKSKDYGVAGIWAVIAGLDGAAGVIVVAIKTADEDARNTYRWGFYLACISSGLTIILGIMLFITRNLAATPNEKARKSRTADYVYGHKPAGMPYYGDHHNQGFQRDDMPLANGVTYHHSPQQYSMYRGDTQPSAPYGNSLPHPRHQQHQPAGYHPFGYDMQRPNQRHSVAESADLSNGYTTELIHAEHSLSRSNRGGDYGRSTQDYHHQNGRY